MSETKPFFSIQVAVYNVERYLENSIRSILKQSYHNFEILLVDDCSSDSSGHLCDELEASYPEKIRVFHNTKNLGLLLTRRVAYREARGEWIVSVDADDELLEDALLTLEHAIREHPCDLVLYNLICRKEDGKEELFRLELQDGHVYAGEEKKQVYLQRYKNDHLNSMCTKAVHRSILDTAADYSCFQELHKGTDIFQSYPILDASQHILYLNKTLYGYNKRANSLTTGWHKNWYHSKKILWRRDDEYLKKWAMDRKVCEKINYSRLKEVISYWDSCYSSELERNERKEVFKFIAEDGLVKQWYDMINKKDLKLRHRLYCIAIAAGNFTMLDMVAIICQKMFHILGKH